MARSVMVGWRAATVGEPRPTGRRLPARHRSPPRSRTPPPGTAGASPRWRRAARSRPGPRPACRVVLRRPGPRSARAAAGPVRHPPATDAGVARTAPWAGPRVCSPLGRGRLPRGAPEGHARPSETVPWPAMTMTCHWNSAAGWAPRLLPDLVRRDGDLEAAAHAAVRAGVGAAMTGTAALTFMKSEQVRG